MRVLAGQYQAYNFIARTIAIEVSDADEEGTLFRSNSAAAKLFTMYMRMTSLRYLWQILVLAVHSLNDNALDNEAGRMLLPSPFSPLACSAQLWRDADLWPSIALRQARDKRTVKPRARACLANTTEWTWTGSTMGKTAP